MIGSDGRRRQDAVLGQVAVALFLQFFRKTASSPRSRCSISITAAGSGLRAAPHSTASSASCSSETRGRPLRNTSRTLNRSFLAGHKAGIDRLHSPWQCQFCHSASSAYHRYAARSCSSAPLHGPRLFRMELICFLISRLDTFPSRSHPAQLQKFPDLWLAQSIPNPSSNTALLLPAQSPLRSPRHPCLVGLLLRGRIILLFQKPTLSVFSRMSAHNILISWNFASPGSASAPPQDCSRSTLISAFLPRLCAALHCRSFSDE